METKLIAILGALVLAVGAIGTVYMQSAFALSQNGTASASDSSSNTQTATNTATATSTGSGNANGNGNTDPGWLISSPMTTPNQNGDFNGNTVASASSDQSISHDTTAAVGQQASCDNNNNTGVSGNNC